MEADTAEFVDVVAAAVVGLAGAGTGTGGNEVVDVAVDVVFADAVAGAGVVDEAERDMLGSIPAVVRNQ